jgi:phage terminase large subunit GpA
MTVSENPADGAMAIDVSASLVALKHLIEEFRPRFRGGIAENAKRFRLTGSAYKSMPVEQDGYFDIETARHLIGILEALHDDGVRVVFIIGATQVFKSIVGNIWVPFVMEHDPDDMLVLFEDDPKAKDFAQKRLMPTIQKHPVLSARLDEETENRHQMTMTKIVATSMSLHCGGLNDGNVSTFSFRYIWVSESWQHKSDGLLRKAMARADRFAESCKILVESQAGMTGEDLQMEASKAHRVPLKWRCPFCDGEQSWECEREFGILRPDDFVARKPMGRARVSRAEAAVPTGSSNNKPSTDSLNSGFEGGGEDSATGNRDGRATSELDLWVAPLPGSYAGMKFDGPEKTINGVVTPLTIAERARSAKWECYHCGTLIEDTKANRRAIAQTYSQDYKIEVNGQRISPRVVCFVLPKESNVDNSFEKSTASYLSAKEAERNGNMVPLQDWYMSERAIFYDPQLSQRQMVATVGSYDPNAVIPDEHSRDMSVDCQKHETLDTVGTFWWEVRAFDKYGNSKQLERGFSKNWDGWWKVQEKWKVPNDRVSIDGSKWGPQVMQMAASRFEEVEVDFLGRKIKKQVCWQILYGDKARSFRHPDNNYRNYSPVKRVMITVFDAAGKRIVVPIKTIRWSNLAYKLQLDAIRMQIPGTPKYESLERKHLSPEMQAIEIGDLTYDKQMSAEYSTEDKKGQETYEKLRKENHYYDVALQNLVRASQDGLIGHVAAAEAAA